ncbi:porin family protein [uncultured Algibacter sp.]|uniref:porin family protein n=1 Tax=uncultured Algibacter sp. TaxID=298659 RepID=UPI002621D445|nr:porin family protein [uncultured Algibacter sp.]
MKNSPLKTCLLIGFLLISLSMQSQVLLSLIFGDKLNSEGLEFGLEGGMNLSSISNIEGNKPLSKFNLGFYFDIRLKNQWNLYTGVLVKSKLGDNNLSENDLNFLEITPEPEDGRYSQNAEYFLIPALIKYSFKNRIYAEAGPQIGYMRKAWVEFNSDVSGVEIRKKVSNTDKLNRIDAGVAFGAGYKLLPKNGMTVGIRYYLGLANVYKGHNDFKHNSLFLKVNIPIGAEKTKEKKQTPSKN